LTIFSAPPARDGFGGKRQKRDGREGGREAGRPPKLAARDRLLSTVEGGSRAASGRVKPPRPTDCPPFKEGGRAASGSKVATGDKVL
jgi:hypothetical protein